MSTQFILVQISITDACRVLDEFSAVSKIMRAGHGAPLRDTRPHATHPAAYRHDKGPFTISPPPQTRC